ncbi:host cell surface-exposed lipoprotein [Rhodococcus sp. OK519]|nr:host cell surface-exposed lipoprotein [Rhodococcus sp. OK519]
MTSFSKSGLIEQLEFEGYTRAQAEYGANAAY